MGEHVRAFRGLIQNLTKAIEDLIATTTASVDISTLYQYPDGYFLQAIRNGIARARLSGNTFVVRIIAGLHFPYKTPFEPGTVIEQFIKDLNVPADIPIYVAGMQTWLDSMNHAKLVIVDGKTAINGGHNMWSDDYTQFAPAHDLSQQISGPVVQVASGFLNKMWTTLIGLKGARRIGDDAVRIFVSRKSFEGVVTDDALATIDSPIPEPQGNTRTLAVARMGKGLMPEEITAYNASHIARMAAVGMCTNHIRFTTPWLGGSPGGVLDDDFVDALCARIVSGVQVSIIMSEKGATTSTGDIYSGESIEDSAKRFVDRMKKHYSFTRDELISMFTSYLHIAPIRIYDKQPGDPAEKSWMWKSDGKEIEPANHAKIYIFDEDGYYFGSDNAYELPLNPLGLQEFGHIIAGREETSDFINNFWNKGWQYSSQFEFSSWADIIK